MCLIMWSCSLLCLCHIMSYLTSSSSSSSSFFPSSKLALSLIPFFSSHSGIQRMDYCCLSCSLSSLLPVVIFRFPFIFVAFSAVSSLNFHQLLFCSPFFFHILSLSFSLSFSHLFFLEPLTIFMPLLSPPFSPLWAPASPG